MRRLVGLACLGLVARAEAEPSAPPPNQDATVAAMRLYVEALTLERWGDSKDAGAKYNDAIALSEGCDLTNRMIPCKAAKAARPLVRATFYLSAARYELALDDITIAKHELDRFLALVPTSTERTAVEQLRAKVDAPDRVVTIGGHVSRGPRHEVDGIVLVDGVLVGPSPATLTVKPGKHVAERVTASTYAVRLFETYKSWAPTYEQVDSSDEKVGNVVIAGDLSTGTCSLYVGEGCRSTWTWSEGKRQLAVGMRFTLPKGHYKTTADSRTCKPFEFDVASTSGLSYVRVDGTRADKQACLDVKHVSTQSLQVRSP